MEKHYASSDQRLSRCFTRLLATFRISGPNGTHNCLVTELVGPCVSRVLRACTLFGETLRPDTVLRASRRVLQAVNFAHHAGVVHGGTCCLSMLRAEYLIEPSTDISFGNVAFTCDVALNGEEDIFVALGGQPLTATYAGEKSLPPNMPRMLVKTADWDMWTDRDEEDIRLLDWGLAFPVGQAVTTLPQPIDLRSPETFFCASIDFRHDLWRAGCVVCFPRQLAGSSVSSLVADQPIPYRSTPCIFSNHRFHSSTDLMPHSWGRWCQGLGHYQLNGISCGRRCREQAQTL
jgi:serine/threonine protein kinase